MAGYRHRLRPASSHPDRPLCVVTPGQQTPNYMVDIRLLLTWNALAAMVAAPSSSFQQPFLRATHPTSLHAARSTIKQCHSPPFAGIAGIHSTGRLYFWRSTRITAFLPPCVGLPEKVGGPTGPRSHSVGQGPYGPAQPFWPAPAAH